MYKLINEYLKLETMDNGDMWLYIFIGFFIFFIFLLVRPIVMAYLQFEYQDQDKMKCKSCDAEWQRLWDKDGKELFNLNSDNMCEKCTKSIKILSK